MNYDSIAIDGPAGAGKSTVAKLAAKKLGYLYIDTGAMYRALTQQALKLKIDLHNGEALNTFLNEHPVHLQINDQLQKVVINDEDVTEEIRNPEVSKNVSLVATHQQVRESMVRLQRAIAKENNVVMDGRDIGTNVLPKANCKIYLNATIEERASRRYKELISKGYKANLEEIRKDIALRDKKDQEREFAPLKKAEDATEIDTSNLNIQQVVNQVLEIVKDKIEGEG